MSILYFNYQADLFKTMKTLNTLRSEPESRRTYKTFPSRIIQSSGIGQRWPFLKWCCPFCFDKPPISRRGSSVPVIKVTRARTPDSDSDSDDAYTAADGQSEYPYDQNKRNIVYRRGYGKNPSHPQVIKDYENDDLFSEEEDYPVKANADTSSDISSHNASQDDTSVEDKQNCLPETGKRRSSLPGFKSLFRKSRDKKCSAINTSGTNTGDIEQKTVETKGKRNSLFKTKNTDNIATKSNVKQSVKSKYSIMRRDRNKMAKSKSKYTESDGGEVSLEDKNKLSTKLDESKDSSDSDPLILSENPIALDNTLDFDNLPLRVCSSMSDDFENIISKTTIDNQSGNISCNDTNGEYQESLVNYNLCLSSSNQFKSGEMKFSESCQKSKPPVKPRRIYDDSANSSRDDAIGSDRQDSLSNPSLSCNSPNNVVDAHIENYPKEQKDILSVRRKKSSTKHHSSKRCKPVVDSNTALRDSFGVNRPNSEAVAFTTPESVSGERKIDAYLLTTICGTNYLMFAKLLS